MRASPWNAATAWWRNWRAARDARGELDGCGSEITRIARDVGVAPAELYTIAAKRPDAAGRRCGRPGDGRVRGGIRHRRERRICGGVGRPLGHAERHYRRAP